MVKVREDLPQKQDGTIDIDKWVARVADGLPNDKKSLIQKAVNLAFECGATHTTPYQLSCFRMGLMAAEVLKSLETDANTLCTAVLCFCLQYEHITIEHVQEVMGAKIGAMATGLVTLHSSSLTADSASNWDVSHQRDNLRRMLLALVEDVRVVLIKLAEQLCILRQATHLDEAIQLKLAAQTRDIYAPLANRLGIGQIKWELEDFAFRFLEPEAYKHIAKLLAEKRVDRDAYIDNLVTNLHAKMDENNVKADILGRAKHIFSIWRKMQRKGIDFKDIYDVRAVRIIVPEIKDCYSALGVVHSLWQHIPKEFDDYIATPKNNGYRSLHTAVIGPEGKTLEIQIRTLPMHQEAELGVAAHWIYKEGDQKDKIYQSKLASLRQILEWQDQLDAEEPLRNYSAEIFDDRVYVFSPRGDVIDLPQKATPLDFAYHIHTEIGHRCRGAKVNGRMVPLTYRLKSGDQVEILTAKEPHPSRDWLNSHLGYCRSSRSKAKIHAWFRVQDKEKHKQHGREIFDRETKRLGVDVVKLAKIAKAFNKSSADDVLVALGAGDISMTQIINAYQRQQVADQPIADPTATNNETSLPIVESKRSTKAAVGITMAGINNLVCTFAKCCKPLPGDNIVGYITLGRGVSIHRTDCPNIINANERHQNRIMPVQWDIEAKQVYPVDIGIIADDRQGLLNDIFTILSKENVNVLGANSKTHKNNQVNMILTLEIPDLSVLGRVLTRILQQPNVIEAYRARHTQKD